MEEIKSLTGYILSIVALVFAFFSPVPGLVLGIISLVMSTKHKNKVSQKGKIMSIFAIIISIIFIIIALLISFGVITLPNIPV
jgi:Na+-driven multidrug efflux pump